MSNTRAPRCPTCKDRARNPCWGRAHVVASANSQVALDDPHPQIASTYSYRPL